MAMLLKVNGTNKQVYPENQTNFSLQELYDLIECTAVERVPLSRIHEMWIDEEGKITGKEENIQATAILYASYPGTKNYIVGNALICQRGAVL